jgi:hypothetical protein
VGVQNSLPVLDFPYLLVAAQILLDIGRPGGIVYLVPVRLGRSLVELLLLLLAAAALALFGTGSVDILIVFGGGPVRKLSTSLLWYW